MNTSELLLLFSIIVILFLIGVIAYLMRGSPSGSNVIVDTAGETRSSTAFVISGNTLSQDIEIHTPAQRIQPELGAGSSEGPQYRRRDYIFSFQERKFYNLLRELIGEEYQIFSKVRMADIVALENEPKDRARYVNLILSRHIDFVLSDAKRDQALLGIELDDSSHTRYDSKENDAFKNTVFKQVGLPLLRFDVSKYSKADVESRIREALKDRPKT